MTKAVPSLMLATSTSESSGAAFWLYMQARSFSHEGSFLMSDVTREFMSAARKYLSEDYLPKIERCLESLEDEEVWRRPNENSNSIGNLVLHLEGNARQWILSGVAGERDERVRQKEFDEREPRRKRELLEKLRATLEEIDGALSSLDEKRLTERVKIQGYDVSVLGAIFHVVEHFSMHTGQIIFMTKMLRDENLAFYDFSSGEPRQSWRKKRESNET